MSMRKSMLALVFAAGSVSVTAVEASTTTMSATPTSSVVGQTVTFTATFTTSCPGALTTHYFTIDGGSAVNGTLAQSGQAGTETLSTAALTVGTHDVAYNWKNGAFCRGLAEILYTVVARPSPSPTPPPSPSPSPRAVPTPASSPSPVVLVASQGTDSPIGGYVGAALIVVVLVAGIALIVLARR